MDIAVVGAGIAGLVAAQLLHDAGHVVTVLERDENASHTAGYRLHLDPPAVDVLQKALSNNVFCSLVASAAGGEAFSRLTVLDQRGETLLRLPRGDGSLMIGRRPLRRILLRGLESRVWWGVTVTALQPSGSARTSILDGNGLRVMDADLVVVADGTGSRLARDVAGRDTAKPAGVIGIAGRTPIDSRTRPLIPRTLWRGPGFVIGEHATSAFLAVHDVEPALTPVPDSDLDPEFEEPYLLWALILDGTTRPASPLLPLVTHATAAWSPPLRLLLRRSEPTSVDAFVFFQPTDLRGWPTDRVAVIGDAAHPIPPTAGIGASISIADAGDLASALGSKGVAPQRAIHDAQVRMLRRARTAARASSRVLTARALLRRKWLHGVAVHVALPLLDTIVHAHPPR